MNSAYPVPVCVKSWYIAPFPTAVDTNYIPLLAYSSIGAAITNASSHKMTNHVWYLFEKLVLMAIFDNPVWCETRDTILTAMVHVDGKTDPLKRVTLSDISFVKLEKKSVADFATKTTPAFFFTKLSFHHHSGKRTMIIRQPQLLTAVLVNDRTKWNVAINQQLLGILAKDEEQV